MMMYICNKGISKVTSLNDRTFTLIDTMFEPNYDGVYLGKIVRRTKSNIPTIEPVVKVCNFKSEYHIRKIMPLIEKIYSDFQGYSCDLCTLRLIKGILSSSISLGLGDEIIQMVNDLYLKLLDQSISGILYLTNDDTSLLKLIFNVIKRRLLSEEKSEQIVTELAAVLTTKAPTDGLKFKILDLVGENITLNNARNKVVRVIFSNHESELMNLITAISKGLCTNCDYTCNSGYIHIQTI